MQHMTTSACRLQDCRTLSKNLQEEINRRGAEFYQPSLIQDTRTMRAFYSLTVILLILSVTFAKEKEDKGKKEAKKGKKIKYNKKGDVGVTVRFNKWKDPNARTLCCPLAHKHCKYPCKGISCRRICFIYSIFFRHVDF